ncbi:unnamed protein product [Tilletia controversa]|uniref:Calcineurin-like phosphoesterase domain-containing protein n=1 Tax=Tilletia controversa TaxID=13291 RepID=A0A8X7MZ18_9BASI|nr:hypothetical protein CF328_g1544 [Tilletia controversa]KAE8253135.1 hypothetical protein A4X06_0g1675 [Tilletia controversa]CAD6904547.1 unnamed protein product [Tilletia controversa]CAD6924295.1 unnamed protein product [Tilletia controversa]CAD6930466.1 unnamed protein product [Tilletia controversa]
MRLSLFGVVALAASALACPGVDHGNDVRPRSQRGATQPSGGTSQIRPLTWGDVVVLSTTDIHGWYQGHLKASDPEPSFSGDWGDFASFVSRMRFQALQRGVDLLLVDAGDLHDGAGLSDAFPPGQVNGQVSNKFHAMVKYDVLAIGNHELYVHNITRDMYENFAPSQGNRYLSSNVNITIAKNGQNVSVPVGQRYVKFRTSHGRKVTAFGTLFGFTGNAAGTTVQPAAAMVNETWFQEAIKEEPDFFLLAGHAPVRTDKTFPNVIAAIRKLHPTTPCIVVGGHTHIRDAVKYEDNAYGIESGRYMETVGWMAFNLTKTKKPTATLPPLLDITVGITLRATPSATPSATTAGITGFSRSYIDANRRNYAFHAGLSSPAKLDTIKGKLISAQMEQVADRWNLSAVFGVAPQDYYLNRVPVTDDHALLNLLGNQVLPTVISTSNPARANVPNLVLANSGSQRFDLYAGNFSKNDKYIVSPFLDAFLYLQDVEYQYATQILTQLNNEGAYRRSLDGSVHPVDRSSTASSHEGEQYARGDVDHIYNAWRKEQVEAARADIEQLDKRAATTLGYVTKDDFGSDGDDTVHTAIPYVDQPDYVGSPVTGNTTAVTPTTKVDVIFVDFIAKPVVDILNGLQSAVTYNVAQAIPYSSLTTQDLYPLFAQAKWQ